MRVVADSFINPADLRTDKKSTLKLCRHVLLCGLDPHEYTQRGSLLVSWIPDCGHWLSFNLWSEVHICIPLNDG